MPVRPQVVIVGGGFGGLNVAFRLAPAAVDITLIDRDNYHGFWPLLYQVATAGLGGRRHRPPHPVHLLAVPTMSGSGWAPSPASTSASGSWRSTATSGVSYDYLVLAAGSSTTDFGIPGVAEHAFPLKTLPDAVRLRNHVLTPSSTPTGRQTRQRPPGP